MKLGMMILRNVNLQDFSGQSVERGNIDIYWLGDDGGASVVAFCCLVARSHATV